MPSNATVATRWTMLPLFAGKNSGKSLKRQEQSENKAANGPVVQSFPRAAVGRYGSERNWMSRAWVSLRAAIVLALTWAAGGLDGSFVRASSTQDASPAQNIWNV